MLTVDIQLSVGKTADVRAKFELLAGECLGVMGDSGVGKTSFLHVLAGLSSPNAGVIRMGNQVWCDVSQGTHMRPEQRQVGLVFQDLRLFPHLNVLQNLLYGYSPTRAAQYTLQDVTSVLAIADLLKRKPAKLSGGEKQRVAIGRALLSQPALLLFDEPMSGLDEGLKNQVLPYISRTLKAFKLPAIYVSHNQQELELVADRKMTLAQGELRQQN